MMSFDLDYLFVEPFVVSSETPSTPTSPKHDRFSDVKEETNASGTETEMCGGDDDIRDTIKTLIQERDMWKARVDDQVETIANLERRIHSKEMYRSELPTDVAGRLNRLNKENDRLQTENAQLKGNLKAAGFENATLLNENDGQMKKLKGANKKARNAKDVAGKEGEKAKGAVQDKQRHLASERKMKKERNDALAALEEKRKANADLKAQLDVEQSGIPHMRDNDTTSKTVTTVVPVLIEIRREDFQKILMNLQAYQMDAMDDLKRYYEDWKKPKEVVQQVVGANYVEDDKKARLYEDMVEMSEGFIETGAEHDGRLSKRGLETICRHAEARHND